MKCSVCVPTYKRPDNLNAVLCSILAMNDDRISQVVVGITGRVKDSTNVMTFQIEKAYQMSGKELVLVNNMSGICGAKEMFQKTCSEEVMLFCDDDCIFDRSYLDLLDWFKNPIVGAVSGSLQTPINVGGYKMWSEKPIEVPKHFSKCNTLCMKDGKLDWSDKLQVFRVVPIDGSYPKFFCEYLIGSCLFVRKDALRIDMAFEKGACAGEEIDFTYDMYKRGYLLVFDSAQVAWHMHSMHGGNRAVERTDDDTMSYLVRKWGLGEEVKGETVYE